MKDDLERFGLDAVDLSMLRSGDRLGSATGAKWAAAIERLLAERDEARKALKPFAEIGEAMTAQCPSDKSPWVTAPDETTYGNQGLAFGDFRRARQALEDKP